jgi:hypothetical protein
MPVKNLDADIDTPRRLQAIPNLIRNPSMTKKSEHDQMAKFLQNMVKSRLFGNRPWMAEVNTPHLMKQVFMGMGLLQPETFGYDPNDPDDIYCFEATPLGEEYDIDLILLMAGIEDCWDRYVPSFVSAQLISSLEEGLIYSYWCLNGDFEEELQPFIRRAYYEYYNIVPGSNEDPLVVPPVSDTPPTDAVDAPPLH